MIIEFEFKRIEGLDGIDIILFDSLLLFDTG